MINKWPFCQQGAPAASGSAILRNFSYQQCPLPFFRRNKGLRFTFVCPTSDGSSSALGENKAAAAALAHAIIAFLYIAFVAPFFYQPRVLYSKWKISMTSMQFLHLISDFLKSFSEQSHR